MQSTQLYKPIPNKFNFIAKNAIVQAEFIKHSKKQKTSYRYLYGFHNEIIIFKDKERTTPWKIIPLFYETKFELIREKTNEKTKIGKPIGIKFEMEGTAKYLELHTEDEKHLIEFRNFLRPRINQRGFHESFKAHRKIGKGNFASVYLADRLEDGKSFAIKAFSKEVAYGQDKGKEAIKKEIDIMRALDHESIIRLHEVYETENSLYIVLDLLEGGSLYDKVKHKSNFTHKEILVIIKTLLEGLSHMNSKRIMHRDLKPENILFRKANAIDTVVIADFGLATYADEEYLFVRCGTPGFVAPEVLSAKEENAHYEPVCDVFSIGLIFYILLTGKPAFPGKSYNDVLSKNRSCEIEFNGPLFENVPSIAKDLLIQMVQKDPTLRITADNALKHSYFNKMSLPKSKLHNQFDDEEEINEEEESYISQNITKINEETTKFDMARINQLQNSPMNSPVLAATSKFKKIENKPQDGFVMRTPLLTGRTNDVEDELLNGKDVKKALPSKFKQSDGVPQLADSNIMQTPNDPTRFRQVGNASALHKYVLTNNMNKGQEQESDKGKKDVKQIKNALSKNI